MRVYIKFIRLFLVLMVGVFFLLGCTEKKDNKDTTSPIITLNGKASQSIIKGNPYKELGAIAIDDRDGNVTVKISGSIDVNKVGTYTITYTAKDKAGNEKVVKRTIKVVLAPDTTKPIITLNGANPQTITKDSKYNELGATAIDDRDGTVNVDISGSVDINKVADYTITYKAKDKAGNEAVVTRTVKVLTKDVPKTKGYLIDSPLSGVNYSCDGIEGLTDDSGMFECQNPPVVFRVGNLTIGTLNSYSADSNVSLQEILGLAKENFSDDTLKLLARFLQSLDDDGDIENRITITKEIREQITKVQDFKSMSESEVKALLQRLGKDFVPECGALKHLGDMSVNCDGEGKYVDNGGNNPPISQSSKIKLLSPQKTTIGYSSVTLEVKDSVADVKAKVDGKEYVGVKNGSSFYIYNVPLVKGKNEIELIADGGSEKLKVELSSEGKGFAPIGLDVKNREGFEKLDTTIKVNTSLSASTYMLDRDSDGLIDESKGSNSFAVSYSQEGRYFPVATVKTSDGVLYSTHKGFSLDVKAKPVVKAISTLAGLNVIDMQMFSSDKYFILTSSNVYEIGKNDAIINTIPIINANNPEGFFVDMEENIFIANTGANQIIKLSKAYNYKASILIDKAGSGDGELNQPKDLVVDSNRGEIFVLDAGNNRVQVFDGLGEWSYSFDGSTTPTGKLKNPTSMIGYFGQPLSIVDSGNGVIRTLQCSKGQKEHEVALIKDGISSNIGRITTMGSLIVPDKGAKKILIFQNALALEKSVDTDKVPNIVISQDELSLIVAYDGESGIKNLKVQIDPKGAEPIDVAKEFVKALIDGDRTTVERLVGNSQRSIDFIYSDQDRLDNAIDFYKHIVSWKQTYHTTSYATVKAHIKTDTKEVDASFELAIVDTQIKLNRTWFIRKLY